MLLLLLRLILAFVPLGLSSEHHNITTDFPNSTSASVSSKITVPIFILTRDRLTAVQKAIKSYVHCIYSPWELVILDDQSTYPPMVDYLRELEESNITVIHLRSTITFKRLVNSAAHEIANYLKTRPEMEYYVVTDPDIILNQVPGDILLFFAGLLVACPKVNVVGPSLRITDLPDHYEKKAEVLAHEKTFWILVPYTASWRNRLYNFAVHPIDTTFAMRRASEWFDRGFQGKEVRTYAPYMAVHLDWYLDLTKLTPDYQWYKLHNKGFSHYT